MSDWDQITERRGKGGFVVRYELMGIIGIMVVQLVAATMWASTLRADVSHMAINVERLTKVVEKVSADTAQKFDKLDAIVLAHEHRITKVEYRQTKE